MHRTWPVALVLACCASPTRAPASRSPPPATSGAAELADALATRTTSPFALAPTVTLSNAGCDADVEPPAAAAMTAAEAELTRRDGEGWNVEVDPRTGYVHQAQRGFPDRSAAPDDEVAIAASAHYLADHYDLLGLSIADLADVTAAPTPERNGSIVWRNEHDGGRWSASITVDHHGQVIMVTARTAFAPAVSLCPQPPISEDAARAAVLGRDLAYFGLGGEKYSAGTVTAASIGKVEVTREERVTATGWTVRLVYHLAITGQSNLTFTAVVDAVTGAVLLIAPNFQT